MGEKKSFLLFSALPSTLGTNKDQVHDKTIKSTSLKKRLASNNKTIERYRSDMKEEKKIGNTGGKVKRRQ